MLQFGLLYIKDIFRYTSVAEFTQLGHRILPLILPAMGAQSVNFSLFMPSWRTGKYANHGDDFRYGAPNVLNVTRL